MTDKYNERSFVRNINRVAESLELITRIGSELSPEVFAILKKASAFELKYLIDDLRKGATDVGARKLDIDIRLNSKREVRHVLYDSVYVLAFDPVTEKVISKQSVFAAPTYDVETIYTEILTAVDQAKPDFFDELTQRQYLDGISIELIEGNRTTDQIIQVTDTGTSTTSTLIGFCLTVTADTPEHLYEEQNSTYVWANTSSGVATSIMNIQNLNSLMLMAERFAEKARIKAAESHNSAVASEASYQNAKNKSDNADSVLHLILQMQAQMGYEVLGDYREGIVIERGNQAFTRGELSYSLDPTQEFPYTTTGIWEEESWRFAQNEIVTAYQFLREIANRQAADANLQGQISDGEPLEASAFSPISWHSQEVASSVTIPENKNAWSFGPVMTIADGQSITIGDNSFWTIANGEEQ